MPQTRLTFAEEIALQAAFMEIKRERRLALKEMFRGTQLKRKSLLADAKKLKDAAAKAKKAVGKIPNVSLPNIQIPTADINFNLNLPKIKISKLINFSLPNIPGVNWGKLPDITLPSLKLPGFFKIDVRVNLPDISFKQLFGYIAINFPHIELPKIALHIAHNFNLDLNLIKLSFPDFFDVDLDINLPNISIPDVNLPIGVPDIDIDIPNIDLSGLEIPGFDIPKLLKLPGFDKVLKLLIDLFDSVDLPNIVVDLGLDFMSDFFASALPIVQQVKSGTKAANTWRKAARDLHRSVKTKKHRQYILPGNAQGAVTAIRNLLRQSSAEHATLATIETTQFAVSTAGLFADLGAATGPAVAAAASFAKMCEQITVIAVEYKQVKKVNVILKTSTAENLGPDIFKVCPLLGCYYIANNTTSNVLNLLSADLLHDDWMTNAERNIKSHLNPLIKDSQRFIEKSRYALDPIRQSKGMYVELSTMEKLKGRFVLAFKKRFGRAPPEERAATHRYIG